MSRLWGWAGGGLLPGSLPRCCSGRGRGACRPGVSSLRFVFQVAQEIWVCEKQTITKWPGDILAYKEHLKSKLVGEEPQLTRRTHNV